MGIIEMQNCKKYVKGILFAVLMMIVGSCTKGFEEMNKDPNLPVDVPAIHIFTHALVNHVEYESGGWMQHSCLGLWAQQWCKVRYIDEDRYMPRNLDHYFHSRYTNALQDLTIVIDKASAPQNRNDGLLAAAKIWRVLIFHYLTDLWGDVPYTEANQGLQPGGTIAPVYDTQESIYKALIAELEEANDLLTSSVLNFGNGDLLFGGDPMAWKKFGNSLQLRILNRVAGTPWSFTYDMAGGSQVTTNAGAAAWGEADAKMGNILANPSNYPVFTSNDDNVQLSYPGLPYRNPIFNALFLRTDQGISQTMVDFLNDRDDPRVHIYAQPIPKSLIAGGEPVYNGHQNGLAHGAAEFHNISLLGTAIGYNENAPLYVLCLDEVEFIQAEFYMRKGDENKAKQHYEAGIKASMDRWGCFDGSTVSPSTKKDGVLPFTYAVDHAAYLTHPLVSWGGNTGEKFRKILEQKWAAMFGQGAQAWTEVRRTGFPARIFEYELEGTYYPDLGMPVRLTYSTAEAILNKANLKAAKERQHVQDINEGLFSPDGTKSQVWWNTRKNPVPTETDPPSADMQ